MLIIKNYSGDIMNFDMAREFAEAEGVLIDYVIVKDDVAVPDSTYSTGRRGIAGTVFVHKIAGAMAEWGASLTEVKAAAQKTIDNVRSMGMAMSACILPGVGKPGFILNEDEIGIGIGMGIHGEPGVEKILSAKGVGIHRALVGNYMTSLEMAACSVTLLKLDAELKELLDAPCTTPVLKVVRWRTREEVRMR